jgi:adenosyl cobinamide kinase/adenosyl cobinamide phosphate guanylyltransferase
MILIIGGAYQGKLSYVMENYPGKTVYHCDADTPEMDFSADVFNSMHLLVLAQIRAGIDTPGYLHDNLPAMKDKIIICNDISCGVVPISSETRQWREATGRCLVLLSKNADEVIRLFCGIGSRII